MSTTAVKTREAPRDSLFLLAQVRIENAGDAHRVRVRNLSDGGMMGEGDVPVRRGDRVTVELRNVHHALGTIAWVEGERFGVAFDERIDAGRARQPVSDTKRATPSELRRSHAYNPPEPRTTGPLRKI